MPDDMIGINLDDESCFVEPGGKIIGGYSVGKPVDDIIVETNHGPQPVSRCRPSIKMPINSDGTFGPTTIIYGSKEYTKDEWHAVRDGLGFPHQVGHHVKVVGRPYGDLPAMDYKITGCAELGSELKIIKLMGSGDVQLADGFYYPHSSYR